MSNEQTARPTRPIADRLRMEDGSYEFETFTSPITCPVGSHGVIPPDKVIPILFVPGIMGSNVRLTKANAGQVKKRFQEEGKEKDFTDESWRPPNVRYSCWKTAQVVDQEFHQMQDSEPVKLGKKWASFGPKLRQLMLDPDGTEVDDRGFLEVPEHLDSPIWPWYPKLRDPREEACRRGWGTVHWDSYGNFLLFLEQYLNGDLGLPGSGPREKGEILPIHCALSKQRNESPLPKNLWPSEQDYKIVQKFLYPVHAVGYNWTQSNYVSAQHLLTKIKEFIGAYRKGGFQCDQVILISHSMGGLVTRICQKMDKENLILGIIHGVMPAIGAPLVYRRMVAGMEGGGTNKALGVKVDLLNVFDNLAGRNTYETTPIMANSPGVLELLPSHLYPKGWLKAEQLIPAKTMLELPSGDDPYREIYKQKDAWYRLVNPKLLDPAGMYKQKSKFHDTAEAESKAWEAYLERIDKVNYVHRNWLGERDYHPNTYVFYGEGESSFATVRWQLHRSANDFSREELFKALQRRELGGGHGQREILVGRLETGPSKNPSCSLVKPASRLHLTSAQVLSQDATGDGTVPVVSGQAPCQVVSNISRLKGFDHQGAYAADIARDFALLGIVKLTSRSKLAQEES